MAALKLTLGVLAEVRSDVGDRAKRVVKWYDCEEFAEAIYDVDVD
jgi:hypothetical protein